jgi:translation initiation factor 1
MSEICSTCGLPRELCVCETIAKESQKIRVYTVKKKFGKVYTSVEGISNRDIDIKEITKRLKNQLACGGTFKDEKIELQGNHLATIRDALVKLGFAPETIETRK